MTTYAGINLTEARQLADLISSSVSRLEDLASASALPQTQINGNGTEKSNGRGEEKAEEQKARTSMLTIAAAAGQLMANVRPPRVVAMELSTSVSPFFFLAAITES